MSVVRDLWWEDSDLHTVDDLGNHYVLQDARVARYTTGTDPGSKITLEEVSLSSIREAIQVKK